MFKRPQCLFTICILVPWWAGKRGGSTTLLMMVAWKNLVLKNMDPFAGIIAA
jgi:hypothetical protein